MPLAYVDVRPIIFLCGLPAFALACLLTCRMLGVTASRSKVAGSSSASFLVLFAVFMTGYGPFIDQREVREHRMTWVVQPSSPPSQPVVELSFVEHPGHFIWYSSEELAQHLQGADQAEVAAVFELTSDYGRLRGYSLLEIAGLRGWAAGNSAGGTRGDPASSPWD